MAKNISVTIDRAGEEHVHTLPADIQQTLLALKSFARSIHTRTFYKYTTLEYAERMLTDGTVRVGTLEYYRRREAEDALRGDSSEGTAAFMDAPVGRQTDENPAPVTRSWFTVPEGAELRNNVWRTKSTVPNVYVFCLSSELSRAAAGTYDACVEITGILKVLGEFTDALNENVANRAPEAEARFAPITYIERDLHAK